MENRNHTLWDGTEMRHQFMRTAGGGKGWGSRYSNPATLIPSGTYDGAQDVAFSPDGGVLVITHGMAPYISAYQWSADTGFGNKYANPSYVPTGSSAYGFQVNFHPAGGEIAYSYRRTPNIIGYKWSYSTGFGANFSTSAIASGSFNCFSPSGNAFAASHSSSPYFSVFSYSSVSGIGTKYANPAVLPVFNTSANGVCFSPQGDCIVVGGYTSSTDAIAAYYWSDSTGFGSKIANPDLSYLGNKSAETIVFSPDGLSLAFTAGSTPGVCFYNWLQGVGFGSRIASTFSASGTTANNLCFHPDGKKIMFFSSSPDNFLNVYDWDQTLGPINKYTAPASATRPSGVTGACFSPDGKAVAMALSATPFVAAYVWN